MSRDLRTETVEDAAALEALAPAWWDLWRRCPAATPFTSPAWALPWWRAFAPGKLRSAAVWDGHALVALAPIYLEEGALGARLLPIGIGISDALDVLVDPAVQDKAGQALVDGVSGHAADWDSWELEELPAEAAALALPIPLGCQERAGNQSASPVLDLSAAQEDPFVVLPARKRRKLRMGENRVARRGGEVRAVGTGEVDTFLDDLTRLHRARWTSRGEAGVLVADPVRGFHALALPELVGAGLARLFTLTIEGRVAGAYYGLQHGGRAYAYLGGFDPDFAFESPGTMLIGHAIAEAAAGGAAAFDFLRGQEPYKYEWGAVDRWSRRRSFRRLDRG
jgi:CelD/BcsL family acetyltransferase involved in cellulose biosynthesis